MTNHIPPGYQAVTPYLTLENGIEAIEFYKRAFDAKERMRLMAPDGKLGHAEIVIGGCVIMMADECLEAEMRNPKSIGDSSVGIHLYVKDVDAIVERSVAEGAILKSQPEDKFYGDRNAVIADPFGHIWFISTHIEDVSPEELKKRMEAFTSPSEE